MTPLLLPLLLKGAPIGLIYADKGAAGSIVLGEAELGLLRGLRDQAVAAFARGATLFAFGNGGSTTDAQDLVADLLDPPFAGAAPLPAPARRPHQDRQDRGGAGRGLKRGGGAGRNLNS